MPWVRKDDRMPWHRKVAPLSDAAYRLLDEAICWSSSNLTDGRIGAAELATISKRGKAKLAAELVSRDLWHTADMACPSEHCPPAGPDGWVIHDFWDYNPSKAEVLAERERKAAAGRLGGVRSGRTRRARKEAQAKQPASADRSRKEAPALSRNEAQGFEPPSRPVPPPSQGEGGTGGARADALGAPAPPESDAHPPTPNGRPTRATPPPDHTALRQQLAAAAAKRHQRDRARADPLA